jgi:hypothetical protein
VSIPYVLYGVPWQHNSAGINAIHRLVHLLNESGQRAYTINPGNPAWNEPLLSSVGGFEALRRECEPIAIYDTIVTHNPLSAARVARWVLLQPGGLGEPHYVPQPNEVTFSWAESFMVAPILRVDVLEHDLFVCDGTEVRTHDTVYGGKARACTYGDTAVPSPVYTGDMVAMVSGWPETRAGVAALMRETRTLYTYDDTTQVSWEALLCGCDVVLLPENVPITMADIEEFLGDYDYDAMLQRFVDVTQAMP